MGAAERAALLTVFGILDSGLVGAFSNTQTLDPDAQACVIHHREHGPHPLMRFADEPSRCVLKTHLAGGGCLNPHFVFDACAAHPITFTEFSIFIGKKFGYQKKTDALDSRRRVGQSCEHQMDYVFCQVVFTGRDKDLGTGQLM